jgi:hypothetical protein
MTHHETWEYMKKRFPDDDYKAALAFGLWCMRRQMVEGRFAALIKWLRTMPRTLVGTAPDKLAMSVIMPSRLALQNKIEELLGEKL